MGIKKNFISIFSNLILLIFLSGLTQFTYAQNTLQKLREGYLTPPKKIKKAVLAPRYKNVTFSELGPDRKYFLHYISRQSLSPIGLYARKWYNLAGLQIDPQANRRRPFTLIKGDFGIQTYAGLELIDAQTGEEVAIQTPEGAHISNAKWAPDGSKVAYFAHFDNGTYIYVADLESGQSRRITKQPVLVTLNTTFEWSGDSQSIFAVLVPDDRGEEPQKPDVASVRVRMTTNTQKRLPTFQDLLITQYEVKLLKYYITGQLARINVANGQVSEIGNPAMIRGFSVAPSGKYAIITRIVEPFSYAVPLYRFAWRKEIWNLDGNAMALLQKSGVDLNIPDSSVVNNFGRSDIEWRPDGEGLSLIIDSSKDKKKEAPNKEKENQDNKDQRSYRVVQWMPPFGESDQKIVYKSSNKINSVSYGGESDVLFIEEDYAGKEHLIAVYADNPEAAYTIYSHDQSDFYDNPGHLMYTTSQTGLPVVLLSPDGQHVFLTGTQYYKNPQALAPRPFIDQVEIKSGEKERIFQSSASFYEEVVAPLDDNINRIVIKRQSPEAYPNYWVINLKTGEETKLTSNHPYNKKVTNAPRKRFKVTRADGITFWVNVILPKNWSGEPLPGIINQYPTEYAGQEDYNEAQRRYNKNLFPRVATRPWAHSFRIMILEGYAVIYADWPVISNQGTPDDGLVWSIRQNSLAVIDSLASKGYVDRSRMAIVGHSFGAFGVVNAMVHTSLFKAGIAGDDTYNRTLTPFGFQRQNHILWNDLGKYISLSPLFYADHLNGALLIYHGMADQNSGTWPEQSWRLIKTLNKLGKTAALYMYPYAAHHTGAKAIVMDRLTRWVQWLNHYVKNSGESIPESKLGQ